MGLKRISVSELPELLSTIEKQMSAGEDVYVLFSGSVEQESGQSWCSDCVRGELPNESRGPYVNGRTFACP